MVYMYTHIDGAHSCTMEQLHRLMNLQTPHIEANQADVAFHLAQHEKMIIGVHPRTVPSKLILVTRPVERTRVIGAFSTQAAFLRPSLFIHNNNQVALILANSDDYLVTMKLLGTVFALDRAFSGAVVRICITIAHVGQNEAAITHTHYGTFSVDGLGHHVHEVMQTEIY